MRQNSDAVHFNVTGTATNNRIGKVGKQTVVIAQ
jgi:hypothetical protein